MWALVERHTGRVGYERGMKGVGLDAEPPAIDCSGWAALLLETGLRAANERAAASIFWPDDIAAVQTWSDRLIEVLERRSGWIIEGDSISAGSLPPLGTIGLRQGGGSWAANHKRPRGITHVVQLVQRPGDLARFVSEAQGWSEPRGVRLMPLDNWLELTRPYLLRGEAWAVDGFTGRRHDEP